MKADAGTLVRPTLREWLIAENPASRFQAMCGSFYRAYLAILANPLALLGLLIVIALVLVALFAPFLSHGLSPLTQDLAGRLAPPGRVHWFGADELGRDIFTRTVYGARATLVIVALVGVIVAPVGLAVGTTAGYLGSAVDKVLMRVTDIFLAFPRLVLALGVVVARRALRAHQLGQVPHGVLGRRLGPGGVGLGGGHPRHGAHLVQAELTRAQGIGEMGQVEERLAHMGPGARTGGADPGALHHPGLDRRGAL